MAEANTEEPPPKWQAGFEDEGPSWPPLEQQDAPDPQIAPNPGRPSVAEPAGTEDAESPSTKEAGTAEAEGIVTAYSTTVSYTVEAEAEEPTDKEPPQTEQQDAPDCQEPPPAPWDAEGRGAEETGTAEAKAEEPSGRERPPKLEGTEDAERRGAEETSMAVKAVEPDDQEGFSASSKQPQDPAAAPARPSSRTDQQPERASKVGARRSRRTQQPQQQDRASTSGPRSRRAQQPDPEAGPDIAEGIPEETNDRDGLLAPKGSNEVEKRSAESGTDGANAKDSNDKEGGLEPAGTENVEIRVAEESGLAAKAGEANDEEPPERPRASLRPSKLHEFALGPEAQQSNTHFARDGVADRELMQKLAAEFCGTFMLVLTVGIAVPGGSPYAPVGIGFVLAIQIYSYGAVSGGLFNPAVTLSVLLSGRGKITPGDAAAYIGVQLLAGLAAGLIAYGITEQTFCFDYETYTPDGGWGTSFFLEVLYTNALCTTVLATGTSFEAPNQYFGFAIGGAVVAGAYACGDLDQGSFNPAVTWGINAGNWANSNSRANPSFWSVLIFTIGPLLGGAMAAAIFRGTRGREYVLSDSGGEARVQLVPELYEKLLAEFTGTFYLVLTVSIAATNGTSQAPVAIGLILGIMVYDFGAVSGGLFNPAVALAVFLAGRNKLSGEQLGWYMLNEFAGSMLAGLLGYGISDRSFCFDFAVIDSAWGRSFMLELTFTGALAMTVLTTGTSKDAPNHYFGFAIGGTVMAGAFACSGWDLGSFNPAVTFGINMGNYANADAGLEGTNPGFDDWWNYFFTPFLGGALAAEVFRLIRYPEYQELALRPAGDAE